MRPEYSMPLIRIRMIRKPIAIIPLYSVHLFGAVREKVDRDEIPHPAQHILRNGASLPSPPQRRGAGGEVYSVHLNVEKISSASAGLSVICWMQTTTRLPSFSEQRA